VALACVTCGAEAREGDRFCRVCGSALFRQCPTCGSEQASSASFCSSCGSALDAGARRSEPGSDQEERRVVTVLFADLVGSTALGERLDPEDVRTLQGELFALVNAEVERFGGVSEKFAGDAVLAVFGVPRTHEDDAERAVRAALAVQAAFRAYEEVVRDRHATETGLRIGVNTGEVVTGRDAASRGELMVSGDAVNVAARLQQLAEPGTVLVGERTQRATRRNVSYGDVVELDAKGKERPVRAWPAREAIGEVGVRGDGRGAPLIGRDDDMALLRLTAARVERERAPQLVTIFGHAGVGKSRLVDELVRGLDSGQAVVGRCVPYGDGITYLPLAQIASELAGIRDDDPSDVALTKLRASVERTVPPEHVDDVFESLAWTVGLTQPGQSAGIGGLADVQHALRDAWARYLAALGREELFVMVVDDVHWASGPLLDLLEQVLDALENTAVLVVCPSRPEFVDTRPTWGSARLNASTVTLAPLTKADAEHLLAALLEGGALSRDVATAILEPADGNPFFVEEMLSMLVEQGALERSNGSWRATRELAALNVPDSIQGVIAARIDLLQASEREALRRCSVMGRVFWPTAVGVDDELVAGLGRRALVYEQAQSSYSGRREFAYKHALTHEVAYGTLPRHERRELHRRVADWLRLVAPDRRAETTELIAYHLEQALRHGGPDPELQQDAFEALLSAGDEGQRRGAYSSAEKLLTRALELAPSAAERLRALVLAGRVDVHTSRYDRALERLNEAIDASAESGDAPLRADALGVKARASWLSGRWEDALGSAVDAVEVLEGLPESQELARALARLSQIEMLRALPSEEVTAARAVEVARRTDERAAEANARINLFTAHARDSVVPLTSEVMEIIELAQASGAHEESVRAVINYLWTAATLGRLEPAEAFVRDVVPRLGAGLAAEGYEEYLNISLAFLVYLPTGRWGDADAEVAKADPRAATNRLVWLTLLTGQALRRGQLDVVDAHLPELRERSLASLEPQRILPMASVAMPRAVLARDDELVRELADATEGTLGKTTNWSLGFVGVARSLAAIGDRERLEAKVQALTEPTVECLPSTILKVGRGLLVRLDGDPTTAARLLLEAERELAAWDRAYDAACLALEAAVALEAAGDRAAAEAATARANAFLEPLGCVNPY
jgi:class 3 adenylate cyclase/tetratricopeptide (TPR) repeat protein